MFQNCGRMEALKPAEQSSQVSGQTGDGQNRFFAGAAASDPLVVFDLDSKASYWQARRFTKSLLARR